MKFFLIALVVLIAAVAIAGLTMPTTYAIERSVTIDAPAAAVHPHLEDLQKWEAWSPFIQSDPSIVTTYGETTVGVGAHQSWTSDSGDGELTLTRSDPATGIAYDMAFLEGDVRAPSVCEMNYVANGDATTVTWVMEGDMSDMMPPVVAGLMRPMVEGMIAESFQQGLQNLKQIVETEGEAETTPREAPVVPSDSGESDASGDSGE